MTARRPISRERGVVTGAGGGIGRAFAAGFAAAPGTGACNAARAALLSISQAVHAGMAGGGVRDAVPRPAFVPGLLTRGMGRAGRALGAPGQGA